MNSRLVLIVFSSNYSFNSLHHSRLNFLCPAAPFRYNLLLHKNPPFGQQIKLNYAKQRSKTKQKTVRHATHFGKFEVETSLICKKEKRESRIFLYANWNFNQQNKLCL